MIGVKATKDAAGWYHANGIMYWMTRFVQWTKGLDIPDVKPSKDDYAACTECGNGAEDHGEYAKDGKTHTLCPGDMLVEGIVRREK